MNYKKALVIFTSILIVAYIFYFSQKNEVGYKGTTKTITIRNKTINKNTSYRSIVNNSINKKPKQKKSSELNNESSLEKECAYAKEFVTQYTADEIVTKIEREEFKFNRKCAEFESKLLAEFMMYMFKYCDKTDGLNFNRMSCKYNLFNFRNYSLYNKIKGKPLDEMTNEELIQGFFAEFGNPKELIAIIEVMESKLPDSPSLFKAGIVKEMFKPNPSGQTELIESISDKLDDALKLNPEDRDLVMIDMFRAAELLEVGGREKIEDYILDEAIDPAHGHYHLAQLAWNNQKRTLSIDELNKALSYRPGDDHYLKTIEKVKSSQFTDPNVFSFIMRFSGESF